MGRMRYWLELRDKSVIVTQEQLAEALHYEPTQTSRIEKMLRDQGIAVFYGKGGCVWTTTECIAQAANQGVTSDKIKIDGLDNG